MLIQLTIPSPSWNTVWSSSLIFLDANDCPWSKQCVNTASGALILTSSLSPAIWPNNDWPLSAKDPTQFFNLFHSCPKKKKTANKIENLQCYIYDQYIYKTTNPFDIIFHNTSNIVIKWPPFTMYVLSSICSAKHEILSMPITSLHGSSTHSAGTWLTNQLPEPYKLQQK